MTEIPPEPEDEGDAARAFDALRAEVAALRRGIEGVIRQGPQAGPAAPDYSPTLGKMEKTLLAIAARLEAVERAPALATTPADQASALRRELHQIGQDARGGLTHSQAQLDATVRELDGMIASARSRRDQNEWLWFVGGFGAIGGILLWCMLCVMLPWGWGTWLEALPFGGRWRAGQMLMRDGSPDSWDRMLRLYSACPADRAVELCEAAMAVGSLGSGQDGGRGAVSPAPSRNSPLAVSRGGSRGN